MIKHVYNVYLNGREVVSKTNVGVLKQGDNLVNALRIYLVDENKQPILLDSNYQLYFNAKRANGSSAYTNLKYNSDSNFYEVEIPNWFTEINGILECNIEFRNLKVDNESEGVTIYETGVAEEQQSNIYYIGLSDTFTFNVETAVITETQSDAEYDQYKDLETRVDEAIASFQEDLDGKLNKVTTTEPILKRAYTINLNGSQSTTRVGFYPNAIADYNAEGRLTSVTPNATSHFQTVATKEYVDTPITRIDESITALVNGKVDKVEGKGLSSNDFTNELKEIVEGSQSYAETLTSTVLSTSKEYTDESIAKLVGTAPDTLDTLQELAYAIQDNSSVIDTLNAAITAKADKTEVYTKDEINKSEGALGEEIATNAESIESLWTEVNSKADAVSVYSKAEIDEIIGDINSLLDYINGEVI